MYVLTVKYCDLVKHCDGIKCCYVEAEITHEVYATIKRTMSLV